MLDLGERYIILIFEDDLPEFDEVVLKSIFEAIARANHVDDFTGKLTFEEANNIIMNSSKVNETPTPTSGATSTPASLGSIHHLWAL